MNLIALILALVALGGAGYGFFMLVAREMDNYTERAMAALLAAIIVLTFVTGSLAERVLL